MLRRCKHSAGSVIQNCLYEQWCRTVKTKLTVRLSEDIAELGPAGAYADVAPGFARNFLIPSKKAKYLTPAQLKSAGPAIRVSAPGSAGTPETAVTKDDAEQLAQQRQLGQVLQQLQTGSLDIKQQAQSAGHTQSRLTAAEVIEAVRDQKGIDLSAELLELDTVDASGPGVYQIPLRCFIAEGQKAFVTVNLNAS